MQATAVHLEAVADPMAGTSEFGRFWAAARRCLEITEQLIPRAASVWTCTAPRKLLSGPASPGHVIRSAYSHWPPDREHPMYVLDRNMQPVPVGVIGELYIGGDVGAGTESF